MDVEIGMRNVEKKLAECLMLIFSAFQLPNAKVSDT